MEASSARHRVRSRGKRGVGPIGARAKLRHIRSHLRPVEPLTLEQLIEIHEASIELLEKIGIEFMGLAARARFRSAGAAVDEVTQIVRIPREMVDQALATTPSSFRVTPRNPERHLLVGENAISFSLVAGPPYVHDCINGRRIGNYIDYVNLIKLAQSFDIIHFIGNQPTAPIELPASTRHLDCYQPISLTPTKSITAQLLAAIAPWTAST